MRRSIIWAILSYDKPLGLPAQMLHWSRPKADSQIQVSNTHALSLSLALSASRLPPTLKPKAYIRLTYSFYEMKSLPSSQPGHAESADLRPDGVRGRWWHETVRGLGVIREDEGLNVGVVRAGAWYGPGGWGGEVMPRVVAGHVYQYL